MEKLHIQDPYKIIGLYKIIKDLIIIYANHSYNFVPDSIQHSSAGPIPTKSSKTKYFTQNEPKLPADYSRCVGWIPCTEGSRFALFKYKSNLKTSQWF